MAVNESDVDFKNNRFPGLRCERKLVDKNIWLWSLRRSASKSDIQIFAKQAFKEAGIHDFKASDGWYRRWTVRWKKRYINDNQNEKTAVKQKRLTRKTVNKKADPPAENKPPPCNNNINNDQINKDLISNNKNNSEQPIQENKDCNCRLKVKVQNEMIGGKKKGERYLNHFKFMVASYAVENSIKDATQRYRVNKETVSYWIQDLNKDSIESNTIIETDEPADIKFIKWLREVCKTDQMLNKSTLLEQVKILSESCGSNESTKKNSWFRLYSKRLLEGDGEAKYHIMYPEIFKTEVVTYARKFSKKSASKLFNIDRKRILEWTQFEKDIGNRTRKISTPHMHVTDKKVDKDVWIWYEQQKDKPSSKEIRERALSFYHKAGYIDMKCSEGWYARWKGRYLIPGAKMNRQEVDNLLLTVLLKYIDSNKPLSYSLLLEQAKIIQGSNFKPSLSWAVRFFKRNSLLLQKMLNGTSPLPRSLINDTTVYQQNLMDLINKNNLKPSNIATFDEFPLNFLSSGKKDKKTSLIPKTGFENCAATLIICYFANGDVLPNTLIVKDSIDCEHSLVNVFLQPNGLNDNTTMKKWFSDIFLRYIKQETVLICDSYAPHKILNEVPLEHNVPRCNVSVIPAGCGSQLLPFGFSVKDFVKSKLESCWEQWNFESVLPSGNLKYPTIKDLLKWTELVHNHINSSKNLLIDSFREAGFNIDSNINRY